MRTCGPTPAVSVVVPCFNGADTLAGAIESIQAQTLDDWELIVFDDGSTDGSIDIARRCAAGDLRIRLIESPHVGIVEALRLACGEAAGDFIARMDADDVAHPDRLAKQLRLMHDEPELAICGTQVRMTGPRIAFGRRRYQTWINALVTDEAMMRELFVECPIPHPTFLIRRTAFEEVGGYEDRGWAEDYDLCMRLFLAGKRFGKVPEPLLDWTESPTRLSMRDPRYAPERFRALKRHYLFQTYLGDRPFYQWGAGEVGKAWLREWDEHRPVAVVDINPRKIGRVIHGVPVIAPEGLPGPGAGYIVIAVGAPDARDEIRQRLVPRGYLECDHFSFLA